MVAKGRGRRKTEAEKPASDGNGNANDDGAIELIESEKQDEESTPVTYNIVVYPSDPPLESLVARWRKKAIVIPKFQRRYVWLQPQASRLIESFLLGLPVPPIFMYAERDEHSMLVVDGQQRLKSIAYFFEGYFGEEDKGGKRPVFRLTGLNEKSPFLNKTYKDLEETNRTAFERLNDSVLRVYVIKQLNPQDDTSIFHVFERLNTGGTSLKGQEIRNCIYHGRFNDLLVDLNKLHNWRTIFGKQAPDKHQRDVELILRFLALRFDAGSYEKPMKDFLSRFMKTHRDESEAVLGQFRTVFTGTVNAVSHHLGDKPFHIRAGLNAAVLDSTLVAFAKHLDSIPPGIGAKYKSLTKDATYKEYVSVGTTDKAILSKRLRMAEERLFGHRRK